MTENILTPEILLTAVGLGVCVGASTISLIEKKAKSIWGLLAFSGIPMLYFLVCQLEWQNSALGLSSERAEALFLYSLFLAFCSYICLMAIWGNWIPAPRHNDKPYY